MAFLRKLSIISEYKNQIVSKLLILDVNKHNLKAVKIFHMLKRHITKLRVTGVLQLSVRQVGSLDNIKMQPNPQIRKPAGPRLKQPYDRPKHSIPIINRHRHSLYPCLHKLYGLRNETNPIPTPIYRCSRVTCFSNKSIS